MLIEQTYVRLFCWGQLPVINVKIGNMDDYYNDNGSDNFVGVINNPKAD